MLDFIACLLLLGASGVVAMSTGTFVLRLPELTNADQVKVICNGDSMIAQFCDRTCRNMSSPGVSLEMDGYPTLTIINPTYDSCKAHGYIHGTEKTVHFAVDLNNQEHTSTSPSPGTTGTSPSPGDSELHSGAIAAGVSVSIFLVLMIIYILYWKVERFRQAISGFYSFLHRNNRNSKEKQEIGTGEKFLQSGSMV